MKTTAITAGVLVISPQILKGSTANSVIRIGLLGCGNRGTVVAEAFVNNTNSRIVALADLFEDKLAAAKEHWKKVASDKGYSGVDSKYVFSGKNAFKEIAHCKEVDMIIISSPDYFHPQHLEEVVKSGKHCYCEKPAAVDINGCLKFIEIGKKAEGKVSLDVGFNVRHAACFYEIVNRIHKGDIGDVSFGAIYYHASAIKYPEYPDASTLERRIRRFYWDRILSGDVIVDQNIHVIDIANWVLGTHPERAVGTGGRKVRIDASDIWDNWTVSFTYPGNVNVNFNSVQYGDFWDVGVRFIGDKGIGESNYNGFGRTTGDHSWSTAAIAEHGGDFSTAGTFDGLGDSDARKASQFIDSIISGKYHNQAKEGAESALSAILGRMAAYQGKAVSWEEMINSGQSYQNEIDLDEL